MAEVICERCGLGPAEGDVRGAGATTQRLCEACRAKEARIAETPPVLTSEGKRVAMRLGRRRVALDPADENAHGGQRGP